MQSVESDGADRRSGMRSLQGQYVPEHLSMYVVYTYLIQFGCVSGALGQQVRD